MIHTRGTAERCAPRVFKIEDLRIYKDEDEEVTKKKALVIDDSPIVRDMVRKVIEPLGYEVIEAADGQIALSLLSQVETPDVAFIDVNMPKMNGVEFATQVHKEGKWSKMAMIMLTTEVNSGLKVEAKSAGVKLWVMKPIIPERLKHALEMVTANS